MRIKASMDNFTKIGRIQKGVNIFWGIEKILI